MRLCVYAITGPGPLRTPARGQRGERLRLVAAGPVAAIVGDVPRTPRATVGHLRRYDETIRRIAASRPALLPARFGTCFGTREELTAVLRSRRQFLQATLAQVRHRAQMTVRVIPPARPTGGPRLGPPPRTGSVSRASAPSVPAAATAGTGGEGSTYLRQRAADAARQHDVPGFEKVRHAVRRWVRAERVETRAGVASVYHLVPRAAADAYRRAAERAGAESGLRIVVSGPWPPYAFGAL